MAATQQRSLGDRERFVAFAFASADLLVEVGADGLVTFAAGAFRARLNRTPESLIGRDAADVLAPEDRGAFQTAVALLPPHGRLGPTALRLADAARTVVSVSGLQLASADAGQRLCLTFAPMPAPPEFRACDGDVLMREATQQLRAGGKVQLGLLEVKGVAGTEAEHRIDRLIASQPDPGGLAARLGPGRYGVVPGEAGTFPNLQEVTRHLEALLGPDDPGIAVVATPIDLATDGLTPSQAARALRHGLAAFARFGADGLRDAGFADGLGGVVARVTARATALRRTVAERRFRLDFQPIVDLETRQLHHHEALMRLEPGVLEPGEGPQDFIALAETIGLTEDLDLAVASMAIAAANAVPEGRHLAFNISGLSTQSRGFRTRLLALLDRDPRGARRVMVELTESAEIEDEDAAAATLRALRARGVPVCIDDFGAGAAAFRYLKSFPTDYVKVDGAFVQAALTSERDRSFVAAMVDLSLAVGAKVVAERIETEEEAEVMRNLGVHYGQGWLFGKPGPL